jgi:hypothetical protein
VKVAFDTATLLWSISPDPSKTFRDRNNVPIHDAKQRIDQLLTELSESRGTIIIPTPVLSELLVRAGNAASQFFDIMRDSRYFKIESFDQRAAIEAAEMTRKALDSPRGKREGSSDSWPKIKFDRQIVAIAKVCAAEKIYSEDKGIITIAHRENIPVISVADLPLPPNSRQPTLPLKPKNS